MDPSSNTHFSEDQIRRYLDYIGKKDRIPKESIDSEEGLAYLDELIALQLNRVPFENLDLHYSPDHTVSLDEQVLFDKIVERKMGRGGYCMQNNLFFGTMLASMGYKIMPCGARVNTCAEGQHDTSKSQYIGWSHSVNVAYINGGKYVVDVGFGNSGPTTATPMIDGWKGRKSWREWDDTLIRYTHIPDNKFRNAEQRVWVYHARFSESGEFVPMYCFSEIEFLPADFKVMNYYVSHDPTVWFTHKVICRKYILNEQGKDIGDITLLEKAVKERKYGKSRIVAELNSEEERVKAFEDYFDITLNEDELRGIRGWVSEIK